MPAKGWMHQQQDRWTCQQEWGQAGKRESFLLPCPFTWAATRSYGPDLGWVFLLQTIQISGFFNQERIPHMCSSAWVLASSRCRKADNHGQPLQTDWKTLWDTQREIEISVSMCVTEKQRKKGGTWVCERHRKTVWHRKKAGVCDRESEHVMQRRKVSVLYVTGGTRRDGELER